MPASLSATTTGAGTPTVAKVMGARAWSAGAYCARWTDAHWGRAASTNLRTRMAAF